MPIKRNRFTYSAFILVVIALGLGSRADFLPVWVHLYIGDVLWALMIFLIIGMVFNRKSTYWVAAVALIFCFSIEVSQLYQATWINNIRYTRVGGLILGFGFVWTDLLAYAIGVSSGIIFEKRVTPKVVVFTIALLLTISLITTQLAVANSGPTYWKGYPSSEVMVVDDNSPIGVKSENLLFDFSGDKGYDFAISGQVTAAYKMVNPTNEAVSVQMAFPLVSKLDSIAANEIAVKVDGAKVPYDMYIGDIINSYGNREQEDTELNFAFANIVSTITNQPYQPKNFSAQEKGMLYTIEVVPTTEERINFTVDFEFDYERTQILTNGFNRYERNGKATRIAAWCYKPEILEIFVLGDIVDFNVEAFTDGELKKTTNLFTYTIVAEETEITKYVMNYVNEHEQQMQEQATEQGRESQEKMDFQVSDAWDSQRYNLYVSALDRMFTDYRGYVLSYQITEQNQYERILTIVYTVDFAANSNKDVSVSYKTTGTMDKTNTTEPIFTYNYLLNPAKSWNSFENLTIEVITPDAAPYIVDSNIELVKEDEKLYRTSLSKLPDNDFEFSLYANESISATDRTYGALKKMFGYFTPIVIGGLIIFAIAAFRVAVSGRSRKRT